MYLCEPRVRVQANPLRASSAPEMAWIAYCSICPFERGLGGLDTLFFGRPLASSSDWATVQRYADRHARRHTSCPTCGAPVGPPSEDV